MFSWNPHQRALILRVSSACIALLLLMQPLVMFGQSTAPSKSANPSADFAQPEFRALWERTDGPVASGAANRSWVWGPQPGASLLETQAQSKDGARPVQYFDKARMELNQGAPAGSPWRVTAGLLVTEMVTGKIQTGDVQFVQKAPSAATIVGDDRLPENPTYLDFARLVQQKKADSTGSVVTATLRSGDSFPSQRMPVHYSKFIAETSHNLPDIMWAYLTQTGLVKTTSGEIDNEQLFDWVYTLGYPISEAYWANIKVDGKTHATLVQLYQRRVLTYTPDFPSGWQVQMGNVGNQYYQWRYGSAVAGTPNTIAGPQANPVPTRIPATGAYVGITGDSFYYAGGKIKLKGANYWLSATPFLGTWASWNGPQALKELQKARDLGVNAIRIGIPFDHKDTLDVVWGDDKSMSKLSPWIIDQMTQLLQVASIYGMKVIFVLFDWYDGHPAAGTKEERSNIVYIQGLMKTFANDDRVLAWDLHNEPDFYDEWKGGKQDQVIDWLARMARYVRDLDNRHPITVGVGDYRSLWYPSSNGTTILSLVDFAAFHCYDAAALGPQIAEIKQHTDKPVLLEEMGWPTSPGTKAPTPNATYDEPTQQFLYTTMLQTSRDANIAGVLQWTLWDFAPASTLRADFQEHFGLVRRDGSLKPAASVFKVGYSGRVLPSDTRTYVPLTNADKPPSGRR
jgi:hypothetical protein